MKILKLFTIILIFLNNFLSANSSNNNSINVINEVLKTFFYIKTNDAYSIEALNNDGYKNKNWIDYKKESSILFVNYNLTNDDKFKIYTLLNNDKYTRMTDIENEYSISVHGKLSKIFDLLRIINGRDGIKFYKEDNFLGTIEIDLKNNNSFCDKLREYYLLKTVNLAEKILGSYFSTDFSSGVLRMPSPSCVFSSLNNSIYFFNNYVSIVKIGCELETSDEETLFGQISKARKKFNNEINSQYFSENSQFTKMVNLLNTSTKSGLRGLSNFTFNFIGKKVDQAISKLKTVNNAEDDSAKIKNLMGTNFLEVYYFDFNPDKLQNTVFETLKSIFYNKEFFNIFVFGEFKDGKYVLPTLETSKAINWQSNKPRDFSSVGGIMQQIELMKDNACYPKENPEEYLNYLKIIENLVKEISSEAVLYTYSENKNPIIQDHYGIYFNSLFYVFGEKIPDISKPFLKRLNGDNTINEYLNMFLSRENSYYNNFKIYHTFKDFNEKNYSKMNDFLKILKKMHRSFLCCRCASIETGNLLKNFDTLNQIFDKYVYYEDKDNFNEFLSNKLSKYFTLLSDFFKTVHYDLFDNCKNFSLNIFEDKFITNYFYLNNKQLICLQNFINQNNVKNLNQKLIEPLNEFYINNAHSLSKFNFIEKTIFEINNKISKLFNKNFDQISKNKEICIKLNKLKNSIDGFSNFLKTKNIYANCKKSKYINFGYKFNNLVKYLSQFSFSLSRINFEYTSLEEVKEIENLFSEIHKNYLILNKKLLSIFQNINLFLSKDINKTKIKEIYNTLKTNKAFENLFFYICIQTTKKNNIFADKNIKNLIKNYINYLESLNEKIIIKTINFSKITGNFDFIIEKIGKERNLIYSKIYSELIKQKKSILINRDFDNLKNIFRHKLNQFIEYISLSKKINEFEIYKKNILEKLFLIEENSLSNIMRIIEFIEKKNCCDFYIPKINSINDGIEKLNLNLGIINSIVKSKSLFEENDNINIFLENLSNGFLSEENLENNLNNFFNKLNKTISESFLNIDYDNLKFIDKIYKNLLDPFNNFFYEFKKIFISIERCSQNLNKVSNYYYRLNNYENFLTFKNKFFEYWNNKLFKNLNNLELNFCEDHKYLIKKVKNLFGYVYSNIENVFKNFSEFFKHNLINLKNFELKNLLKTVNKSQIYFSNILENLESKEAFLKIISLVNLVIFEDMNDIFFIIKNYNNFNKCEEILKKIDFINKNQINFIKKTEIEVKKTTRIKKNNYGENYDDFFYNFNKLIEKIIIQFNRNYENYDPIIEKKINELFKNIFNINFGNETYLNENEKKLFYFFKNLSSIKYFDNKFSNFYKISDELENSLLKLKNSSELLKYFFENFDIQSLKINFENFESQLIDDSQCNSNEIFSSKINCYSENVNNILKNFKINFDANYLYSLNFLEKNEKNLFNLFFQLSKTFVNFFKNINSLYYLYKFPEIYEMPKFRKFLNNFNLNTKIIIKSFEEYYSSMDTFKFKLYDLKKDETIKNLKFSEIKLKNFTKKMIYSDFSINKVYLMYLSSLKKIINEDFEFKLTVEKINKIFKIFVTDLSSNENFYKNFYSCFNEYYKDICFEDIQRNIEKSSGKIQLKTLKNLIMDNLKKMYLKFKKSEFDESSLVKILNEVKIIKNKILKSNKNNVTTEVNQLLNLKIKFLNAVINGTENNLKIKKYKNLNKNSEYLKKIEKNLFIISYCFECILKIIPEYENINIEKINSMVDYVKNENNCIQNISEILSNFDPDDEKNFFEKLEYFTRILADDLSKNLNISEIKNLIKLNNFKNSNGYLLNIISFIDKISENFNNIFIKYSEKLYFWQYKFHEFFEILEKYFSNNLINSIKFILDEKIKNHDNNYYFLISLKNCTKKTKLNEFTSLIKKRCCAMNLLNKSIIFPKINEIFVNLNSLFERIPNEINEEFIKKIYKYSNFKFLDGFFNFLKIHEHDDDGVFAKRFINEINNFLNKNEFKEQIKIKNICYSHDQNNNFNKYLVNISNNFSKNLYKISSKIEKLTINDFNKIKYIKNYINKIKKDFELFEYNLKEINNPYSFNVRSINNNFIKLLNSLSNMKIENKYKEILLLFNQFTSVINIFTNENFKGKENEIISLIENFKIILKGTSSFIDELELPIICNFEKNSNLLSLINNLKSYYSSNTNELNYEKDGILRIDDVLNFLNKITLNYNSIAVNFDKFSEYIFNKILNEDFEIKINFENITETVQNIIKKISTLIKNNSEKIQKNLIYEFYVNKHNEKLLYLCKNFQNISKSIIEARELKMEKEKITFYENFLNILNYFFLIKKEIFDQEFFKIKFTENDIKIYINNNNNLLEKIKKFELLLIDVLKKAKEVNEENFLKRNEIFSGIISEFEKKFGKRILIKIKNKKNYYKCLIKNIQSINFEDTIPVNKYEKFFQTVNYFLEFYINIISEKIKFNSINDYFVKSEIKEVRKKLQFKKNFFSNQDNFSKVFYEKFNNVFLKLIVASNIFLYNFENLKKILIINNLNSVDNSFTKLINYLVNFYSSIVESLLKNSNESVIKHLCNVENIENQVKKFIKKYTNNLANFQYHNVIKIFEAKNLIKNNIKNINEVISYFLKNIEKFLQSFNNFSKYSNFENIQNIENLFLIFNQLEKIISSENTIIFKNLEELLGDKIYFDNYCKFELRSMNEIIIQIIDTLKSKIIAKKELIYNEFISYLSSIISENKKILKISNNGSILKFNKIYSHESLFNINNLINFTDKLKKITFDFFEKLFNNEKINLINKNSYSNLKKIEKLLIENFLIIQKNFSNIRKNISNKNLFSLYINLNNFLEDIINKISKYEINNSEKNYCLKFFKEFIIKTKISLNSNAIVINKIENKYYSVFNNILKNELYLIKTNFGNFFNNNIFSSFKIFNENKFNSLVSLYKNIFNKFNLFEKNSNIIFESNLEIKNLINNFEIEFINNSKNSKYDFDFYQIRNNLPNIFFNFFEKLRDYQKVILINNKNPQILNIIFNKIFYFLNELQNTIKIIEITNSRITDCNTNFENNLFLIKNSNFINKTLNMAKITKNLLNNYIYDYLFKNILSEINTSYLLIKNLKEATFNNYIPEMKHFYKLNGLLYYIYSGITDTKNYFEKIFNKKFEKNNINNFIIIKKFIDKFKKNNQKISINLNEIIKTLYPKYEIKNLNQDFNHFYDYNEIFELIENETEEIYKNLSNLPIITDNYSKNLIKNIALFFNVNYIYYFEKIFLKNTTLFLKNLDEKINKIKKNIIRIADLFSSENCCNNFFKKLNIFYSLLNEFIIQREKINGKDFYEKYNNIFEKIINCGLTDKLDNCNKIFQENSKNLKLDCYSAFLSKELEDIILGYGLKECELKKNLTCNDFEEIIISLSIIFQNFLSDLKEYSIYVKNKFNFEEIKNANELLKNVLTTFKNLLNFFDENNGKRCFINGFCKKHSEITLIEHSNIIKFEIIPELIKTSDFIKNYENLPLSNDLFELLKNINKIYKKICVDGINGLEKINTNDFYKLIDSYLKTNIKTEKEKLMKKINNLINIIIDGKDYFETYGNFGYVITNEKIIKEIFKNLNGIFFVLNKNGKNYSIEKIENLSKLLSVVHYCLIKNNKKQTEIFNIVESIINVLKFNQIKLLNLNQDFINELIKKRLKNIQLINKVIENFYKNAIIFQKDEINKIISIIDSLTLVFKENFNGNFFEKFNNNLESLISIFEIKRDEYEYEKTCYKKNNFTDQISYLLLNAEENLLKTLRNGIEFFEKNPIFYTSDLQKLFISFINLFETNVKENLYKKFFNKIKSDVRINYYFVDQLEKNNNKFLVILNKFLNKYYQLQNKKIEKVIKNLEKALDDILNYLDKGNKLFNINSLLENFFNNLNECFPFFDKILEINKRRLKNKIELITSKIFIKIKNSDKKCNEFLKIFKKFDLLKNYSVNYEFIRNIIKNYIFIKNYYFEKVNLKHFKNFNTANEIIKNIEKISIYLNNINRNENILDLFEKNIDINFLNEMKKFIKEFYYIDINFDKKLESSNQIINFISEKFKNNQEIFLNKKIDYYKNDQDFLIIYSNCLSDLFYHINFEILKIYNKCKIARGMIYNVNPKIYKTGKVFIKNIDLSEKNMNLEINPYMKNKINNEISKNYQVTINKFYEIFDECEKNRFSGLSNLIFDQFIFLKNNLDSFQKNDFVENFKIFIFELNEYLSNLCFIFEKNLFKDMNEKIKKDLIITDEMLYSIINELKNTKFHKNINLNELNLKRKVFSYENLIYYSNEINYLKKNINKKIQIKIEKENNSVKNVSLRGFNCLYKYFNKINLIKNRLKNNFFNSDNLEKNKNAIFNILNIFEVDFLNKIDKSIELLNQDSLIFDIYKNYLKNSKKIFDCFSSIESFYNLNFSTNEVCKLLEEYLKCINKNFEKTIEIEKNILYSKINKILLGTYKKDIDFLFSKNIKKIEIFSNKLKSEINIENIKNIKYKNILFFESLYLEIENFNKKLIEANLIFNKIYYYYILPNNQNNFEEIEKLKNEMYSEKIVFLFKDINYFYRNNCCWSASLIVNAIKNYLKNFNLNNILFDEKNIEKTDTILTNLNSYFLNILNETNSINEISFHKLDILDSLKKTLTSIIEIQELLDPENYEIKYKGENFNCVFLNFDIQDLIKLIEESNLNSLIKKINNSNSVFEYTEETFQKLISIKDNFKNILKKINEINFIGCGEECKVSLKFNEDFINNIDNIYSNFENILKNNEKCCYKISLKIQTLNENLIKFFNTFFVNLEKINFNNYNNFLKYLANTIDNLEMNMKIAKFIKEKTQNNCLSFYILNSLDLVLESFFNIFIENFEEKNESNFQNFYSEKYDPCISVFDSTFLIIKNILIYKNFNYESNKDNEDIVYKNKNIINSIAKEILRISSFIKTLSTELNNLVICEECKKNFDEKNNNFESDLINVSNLFSNNAKILKNLTLKINNNQNKNVVIEIHNLMNLIKELEVPFKMLNMYANYNKFLSKDESSKEYNYSYLNLIRLFDSSISKIAINLFNFSKFNKYPEKFSTIELEKFIFEVKKIKKEIISLKNYLINFHKKFIDIDSGKELRIVNLKLLKNYEEINSLTKEQINYDLFQISNSIQKFVKIFEGINKLIKISEFETDFNLVNLFKKISLTTYQIENFSKNTLYFKEFGIDILAETFQKIANSLQKNSCCKNFMLFINDCNNLMNEVNQKIINYKISKTSFEINELINILNDEEEIYIGIKKFMKKINEIFAETSQECKMQNINFIKDNPIENFSSFLIKTNLIVDENDNNFEKIQPIINCKNSNDFLLKKFNNSISIFFSNFIFSSEVTKFFEKDENIGKKEVKDLLEKINNIYAKISEASIYSDLIVKNFNKMNSFVCLYCYPDGYENNKLNKFRKNIHKLDLIIKNHEKEILEIIKVLNLSYILKEINSLKNKFDSAVKIKNEINVIDELFKIEFDQKTKNPIIDENLNVLIKKNSIFDIINTTHKKAIESYKYLFG